MKISVKRTDINNKRIIGMVYIDDVYFSYSLESPLTKLIHPAIPVGTYPVLITFSHRFGRNLPLVDKVPEREGIRIHPGNSAADTQGCILVGRGRNEDTIFSSRVAVDDIYKAIHDALAKNEEVTLTIV